MGNKLTVQKITEGLHKPVFLSAPISSSDTLFIVEQNGVILFYNSGELIQKPLLDIRGRVHQPKMPGDERGLLGMALHPEFKENGQLFVNYIDRDDYSIISRFEVNLVDYIAAAESELITTSNPIIADFSLKINMVSAAPIITHDAPDKL